MEKVEYRRGFPNLPQSLDYEAILGYILVLIPRLNLLCNLAIEHRKASYLESIIALFRPKNSNINALFRPKNRR